LNSVFRLNPLLPPAYFPASKVSLRTKPLGQGGEKERREIEASRSVTLFQEHDSKTHTYITTQAVPGEGN